MLLQFKFKNFKSFVEETAVDLVATGIKDHQNTLLEKNGIKVLPVIAFFGANASGKSNFFLAFESMRSIVVIGNKEKLLTVVPYIFNEKSIGLPTEYEVCVTIDDTEYRYGFECNKEEILSEWLFRKPFSKGTRAKEKLVFYREGNVVEYGKLSTKELEELNYAKNMALKDQLFLNIVGNRNVVGFSEIYNWFHKNGIFNMADLTTESVLSKVNIEYLYHNQDLKEEVKTLINILDSSILDLQIEAYKDENFNEKYRCFSIHQTDMGTVASVPFDIESSGTKKLLALAVYMILTLQIGSVLFVDELDAKLHPLFLRYIIQLFTNKDQNKNNAQLIFSAHNIVCLDSSDLRRDEIWFVEKNDQKSEIFSLSDFKINDTGIRSDLAFGKHYLAGRFGAVPFQKEELDGGSTV